MIIALAERYNLTVLARDESADAVRQWCAARDDRRIEAIIVPEADGALAEFWRAMPRGYFYIYLDWLKRAEQVARELLATTSFAGVVHAALGSFWLPTPAVSLGLPSVWGSLGGATRAPLPLVRFLGWHGAVMRGIERVATGVGSCLPATRRTMRDATLALVDTPDDLAALPSWMQGKARMFNRAALAQVALAPCPPGPRESWVMFPHVLEGRKGGLLAVEAMRHTPSHVRLRIFGEGPDEGRMRRRAKRLGIADRVEFVGRRPRDEALAEMQRAAVVLFTLLCENGSCALVETMLLGVPLVMLDHGGPGFLVNTYATDRSRVAAIRPGDAETTARALGAALTRFVGEPPAGDGRGYFDQARAIAELLELTERALAGGVEPVRGPVLRRDGIQPRSLPSSARPVARRVLTRS